jgi:sulfofructose kinase
MIVAVGYANLDLVVQVPALPAPGQRVHAGSIERFHGGMAANAAAAARVFGAEVAFVGAVGAEPDGDWLLCGLADLDVDVAEVRRDRWTTHAVVLVAPDGQRAIVSQDDAVDAGDVRRALDRARPDGVLYLDGYRWPWAEPVVADRPSGVRVVVDLDGLADPAGLGPAARAATHLLCSRDHFASLVDASPEAAATAIARRHGPAVVLTRGAAGWWATDGHSDDEGAGHAVEVVDTTGAGDVFAGVFAARTAEGASTAEAARWANAAAALSTTGRGARGHLADRSETAALLAGAHGTAVSDPAVGRDE